MPTRDIVPAKAASNYRGVEQRVQSAHSLFDDNTGAFSGNVAVALKNKDVSTNSERRGREAGSTRQREDEQDRRHKAQLNDEATHRSAERAR